MGHSLGRDLVNSVIPQHCGLHATATAAGSGDATEVVGTTIDITALAARPQSVMFLIPVEATLQEDETITLAADIEVSTDGGSTWSAGVASATLLTLTGDTGGSTEVGVAKVGMNLAIQDINAVRVNYTPDLSASGTDTAKIGSGVAVFGGLDTTPQA